MGGSRQIAGLTREEAAERAASEVDRYDVDLDLTGLLRGATVNRPGAAL